MSVRARARTIPAPATSILAATDLGNVEVAKHGNLYLLTDPRGDVRIDGRGLGLYELDTRVLSTSTLRLNGVPLTLLRGPYLRDGLDTIQLTNPELRRNPEDKHAPPSHLRNRELSVTRTRRLHGELSEQVTVVNYSPTVEALELQLGLGVDMADIFEVRGYARPTRGRLLPIELSDERVDFGYVGLDGVTPDHDRRRRGRDRRSHRRPRHLAGCERARHVAGPARAERPGDGRLDGDDDQAAGRRGRTRRRDGGRRASGRRPPSGRPRRRPGPRSRPHRRPRRCRRRPRIVFLMRRGSRRTTSSSIARSGARCSTWACSGTTGRPRARRISPPGSRGSRRCSGATASSPRSSWSRSTRPSRSRR